MIPHKPTPEQLHQVYKDGFQGWIWNEAVKEEWINFCSSYQSVYAVNPALRGLHKERPRALLYLAREKYDPGAFTQEAQTTGDCFLSGTRVRMSDGSEKEIQDIVAGDEVLSHRGFPRKVLSTIRKDYNGYMYSVKCEGNFKSLRATEDHLFLTYQNLWPKSKKPAGEYVNRWDNRSENLEWSAISDMQEGEYALFPKLPNSDGVLPSDLCWLIGLFLAEGSTCYYRTGTPYRITFNLGSHEQELAEKVTNIIREYFDVEARITTVSSKPSVLYVRCAYAKVVKWMCSWVSGNVYSKRVDSRLQLASKDNKLALLKGWLDGDGHLQLGRRNDSELFRCKLSGSSVNYLLVEDMRQLALSCDLRATTTRRKAYKQSKESYELHIYSSDVLEVYPEEQYALNVAVLTRDHRKTALGLAAKIQKVSKEYYSGEVYCIEVEEDHSFIAEGFAVHNCTSHGDRNARDITRSVEILNGDSEKYYLRGATEPTYGARGHSGQGMDPYRAAKFVTEWGFLFRESYRDSGKGISLDLSKYNANIGINWGRGGVPQEIKELCKQYNVGEFISPKAAEEALDLLAAGKACHSGQSWGTSDSQRSDGINRKSESWSHDMATGGYDLTREFFREEVVFVHNSWARWNEPNPVWLAHEDVYGKWIPGTIVVSLEEWEEYFVNSGSIHFYSDVKGFPISELPFIDIEMY